MDEDTQLDVAPREIWKDYLDRQAFEHQLIDRKTGWMLSTESILFAAFAVSLRSDTSDVGYALRLVIPVVGVAISLLWWFAIERLVQSKRLSWKSYKQYFGEHPGLVLPAPCYGVQKCSCKKVELQWGVETTNTERSLWPDRVLPLVIGAAWSVLSVVVVLD